MMNSLSVIIPALNEELHLPDVLERLQAMPQVSEVIVCDGGSTDKTVALARNGGARVVSGNGRGAQMNAGARMASCRVLWFLHADAKPHPHSAAKILQALKNPQIFGGNFRLKFELSTTQSTLQSTQAARLFENIARMQRRFGIYYGDSGIWLRREVFQELGGYRDWPLFEDYDLARRLEEYARRKHGRTIRLWPALIASSRRFETRPWSTLAKWLSLQILFHLGFAPEKLARLYR